MLDELPFFPICGLIDSEGRLIDADPPLAALHAQGGGVPGGRLAIPQLAALVALVGKLGVAVSRPVTTGDDGTDIELFVRARPEEGGVALEIDDWVTRPARPAIGARYERRDQDFARAGADFSWAVDKNLILTEISPRAAGSLGNTESALVGQPLTRLFGLFEAPDGHLPMLDAVADHKPFEGQRARLRGSDHGILELSGTPLLDERGQFAGYRGHALEIGEQPVRSLEEQDQSFGVDIGRALKGPLDRIITSADVIRAQSDGPLRRGYADYATDIASAGRHLLSLVDDLIELQTIEHADFRPEVELIDLCDIARRAAGLLTVRAADSQVIIDKPEEHDSLPATGSFRRVLQIMVNLIGNAIRHSPPGGMIWLRAEQDGDRAILIIADQGQGIAPADHQRIFEKFERIAPGNTPGSGLGLYISRRLARAMNGDLVVDSAAGQGARFILTLPIKG